MMVSNLRAVLACLYVLFFTACSPIDRYEDGLERVEKSVKADVYKKKVDTAESAIKTLSDDERYLSLLKGKAFSDKKSEMQGYVNEIALTAKSLREMESMKDNQTNVINAGRLYDKILKNESKLRVGVRDWVDDYTHIKDVITRTDEELALVNSEYAKFNTSKAITFSKIEKAKSDFPSQTERLSLFKNHLLNFDRQFNELIKFLDSKDDKDLQNYLDYIALYSKVNVKKNAGLSLSDDYQRMIEQLYSSYSKILVDMDETHGLALAAVSWDDYYDHTTETPVNFPYVEVSKSTLDKALRRYRTSSEEYIHRLKSDQFLSSLTNGRSKTAWRGGDDKAEIWLEDYESEYTHVYGVIENGKMSQVEESVSERVYRKLENAKGQEVLSKPYGKFEDEVIDEPQSPGMNYVGNPMYGQWQKDPVTGGDIWVWLAAYAIMDDIIDDRIDRRRHERYMASMNSYVPPRQRQGYSATNRFGVTRYDSPIQQSLTRSRKSNLKGAGASFRNRGSSSGK